MINKSDVDEVLDEAQMVADEQKDEVLPEAPAVSNIKVWIRGFGVMLTVRGEKMMDIVKKTETLVDYAESHEWKNVWDTAPSTSQPIVGQPTPPKAPVKGQPTCSIHGNSTKWLEGVSKKTGKKYAFWSCQEKINGQYCQAELVHGE